jgi:hypothetical protein
MFSVDARDHRRRGRLDQARDVTDVDHRAVAGAHRNRPDRGQRVLRDHRIGDQHVLETVGAGELRGEVAAERRADRRRRRTDAGIERARAVAVELDVDLRRVACRRRGDVDRARRLREHAHDLGSVSLGIAVEAADDLVDGLRVATGNVGRRNRDGLGLRHELGGLLLQVLRPVGGVVSALVVQIDIDLCDRRIVDVAGELAQVRTGGRRLRPQIGNLVDGLLDLEHSGLGGGQRRAGRIRHRDVQLAAVDRRDVFEADQSQR